MDTRLLPDPSVVKRINDHMQHCLVMNKLGRFSGFRSSSDRRLEVVVRPHGRFSGTPPLMQQRTDRASTACFYSRRLPICGLGSIALMLELIVDAEVSCFRACISRRSILDCVCATLFRYMKPSLGMVSAAEVPR